MPITITGSGTLTGISAGGLPDGSITADDLATTLDLSGKTLTLPAGVGGNPAGTVITVAMSTAPSGYVKCDGAAISRTTFADLFAAISTTYGAGDGSTTFNVPDLRGEFVRGFDDGRGVDSGRAIGTTQTDAFQGHRHALQRTQYTPNFAIGGAGAGNLGNAVTNSVQDPTTDGVNGTPRTASETRPRNVALLYCIKT